MSGRMPSLNRPALALGFVLGLVLAVSPSCSSSSNGGTGGGSGMGGGNGSAAIGDCNDFVDAYCDLAIRCKAASTTAKADCITNIKPQFCSFVAASAVKGFETFDSAKGATCLAALKAVACENVSSEASSACENVFAPASSTNGGCLFSNDCKNPSESCGG